MAFSDLMGRRDRAESPASIVMLLNMPTIHDVRLIER
jgi:hypothetical protein